MTLRKTALFPIAALAFAGSAASGEVVNIVMTIDGDQEQPAVDTPATGAGTATLDTDTNMLTWHIEFEGLIGTETAAHFHGIAAQCETAGVQIGLPLGSPKDGKAELTDEQVMDVLAGLWYVNIHSDVVPSGEIRGQLMPGAVADPIPPVIAAGAVHVRLETVATGMTAPNWGTSAPGDEGRLFVTDQNGILWAVDLATGDKTVFLDVAPLLVDLGIFGEDSFDERGLLGVAFHPDYQKNGLLYTYTSEHVFKPADFSTMPPDVLPNHRTVIREWRVPDPADPEAVVDPTTARALMRIDQPQFNHNAGAICFGPDDMLYIALGDGGGGDDKDGQVSLGAKMVGHGCIGNGQNAEGQSVLGSVLRIDPLGDDASNGQYGIPGDNPFVGNDPRIDEIFAYGFRNPFRMSFDTVTGELYVADVGQNHVEEINVVESGGNYGWNYKEGSFFFAANGNERGYATDRELDVPDGLIDPVAEYDHDEGIAIVGGFVYRGTKIAPLSGRYVFGEFAVTFSNDGRLFYLDEKDEILEFELVDQEAFGLSLLGFGQDARGEVYALANATGVPFGDTGLVLKVTTKPGDFDANGVTGFPDLLVLLANWGPCPGCPADINDDGETGFPDLLILLANWG